MVPAEFQTTFHEGQAVNDIDLRVGCGTTEVGALSGAWDLAYETGDQAWLTDQWSLEIPNEQGNITWDDNGLLPQVDACGVMLFGYPWLNNPGKWTVHINTRRFRLKCDLSSYRTGVAYLYTALRKPPTTTIGDTNYVSQFGYLQKSSWALKVGTPTNLLLFKDSSNEGGFEFGPSSVLSGPVREDYYTNYLPGVNGDSLDEPQQVNENSWFFYGWLYYNSLVLIYKGANTGNEETNYWLNYP
jgi:hypothetical protein